MGVRNATVRRLAVPDLTTTVLTMTLTGLAADSSLAGGTNRGVSRRTAAVAAMLGGAVTGAALFLHIGAGLPLLAAALLVVVTGLAFGRSTGRAVLDSPEPGPGATMVDVSDVSQVTNNQAASRFELQADGGLAELTYRRNGKRLVLMHTEVPVELEGRGLGGILVSAAVDYAALEGMTVVPLCPFASGWLERHPDVAARATIDWGDPG
jgi:predicted GNAT family acetyltransferase